MLAATLASEPRMRLRLGLLATLCFVCSFALGQQSVQEPSQNSLDQSETGTIRVMSFNIRYGTANDGANRWELRRELLLSTIQKFNPDLLGTQETLAAQKNYLDEKLTHYESVGVGRDDGKDKGEMTSLWFRRDRFDLLDSGHFWLSEQPTEPGSISWDSSLTRMATWVKLRQRNSANVKPILFLNTHFDHRGNEARRQSAILVRRMASQLGEGCDIVITGDFNAAEDSPPYRELFAARNSPEPVKLALFRDSFRVAYPELVSGEGTFNGFNPRQTTGPRIDWIGISSDWKVVEAGIDRSEAEGRVPSDHFPVTAVLGR